MRRRNTSKKEEEYDLEVGAGVEDPYCFVFTGIRIWVVTA